MSTCRTQLGAEPAKFPSCEAGTEEKVTRHAKAEERPAWREGDAERSRSPSEHSQGPGHLSHGRLQRAGARRGLRVRD